MSGLVQALAIVDGREAGPVPRLFAALTMHRYDLPEVSALAISGLLLPVVVLVTPPFVDSHLAM